VNRSGGRVHQADLIAFYVMEKHETINRVLKKAASGVPCLRRSGFASTRCSASTRKRTGRSPLGRAHVLPGTLRPSKWLRPSLRAASGQDRPFEPSRNFFVWLRVIHMRINRHNMAVIQQFHQENGPATLPIGDWMEKVSWEHF
jgi:hypothetical protein